MSNLKIFLGCRTCERPQALGSCRRHEVEIFSEKYRTNDYFLRQQKKCSAKRCTENKKPFLRKMHVKDVSLAIRVPGSERLWEGRGASTRNHNEGSMPAWLFAWFGMKQLKPQKPMIRHLLCLISPSCCICQGFPRFESLRGAARAWKGICGGPQQRKCVLPPVSANPSACLLDQLSSSNLAPVGKSPSALLSGNGLTDATKKVALPGRRGGWFLQCFCGAVETAGWLDEDLHKKSGVISFPLEASQPWDAGRLGLSKGPQRPQAHRVGRNVSRCELLAVPCWENAGE